MRGLRSRKPIGFRQWVVHLLTRESPDQKDEKSAENPNFKISGSGSKDTMSPLDQSWDMHISSGIFGSDDFSGFSGFGKGKDGGE